MSASTRLASDPLADFRRAWDQSSSPPSLLQFVESLSPREREQSLIELAAFDIECQWSRGTPRRIEDYVRDFPELHPVPTDLILAEYRARQRYATTASVQEYYDRFPDRVETIAALLSGTQQAPASFHSHIPAALIEAGQRIDDFDLLAQVGEGSFARVFLARQRSLQRLVALKISANRGAEPQTLAQLDHPHIVRVYDQRLLVEQGLLLLYMPYLPGGTLADVLERVRQTPANERSGKLLLQSVDEALARRGEVPPTDSNNRHRVAGMTWGETICWLGARLADALDYAHKRGVIHRDLKPANILLGSDAAPRLADFNVSSSLVTTNIKQFGGSIAYMSPEQLKTVSTDSSRTPPPSEAVDTIDGRSDLYSLAVTLWELLTGQRPIPNVSLDDEWSRILAGLAQRRNEPIPKEAFDALPASLPPGLVDVLVKCLSPNPDNRFASAGELARQFELCLKPETRRLLIPTPGWRTWVGRHPIISLLAVGLVPNIVAAVFNIEYNRTSIVEPYPAVRETFQFLQIIVNGTFFPACMTLFGWFLWPIVSGLSRLRQAPPNGLDDRELAMIRRRCVNLGMISVMVCLWAWVLAGVIFPVVMHLRVQHLPMTVHLHFLISQTLSGLLAVAYPQFGVTFLAIRCIYPQFVKNAVLPEADGNQLWKLNRLQGRFLLLAASVPMLAVALLTCITTENRAALFVLSVVAMAGFATVSWLTNEIRNDCQALEAIQEGAGD
ncbi:MAG: serine/threonine-protein kinase [Gemmataceae bacterium]